MATHYEVLGVRPSATQGEMRAAYVSKARALHPDRHAGASAAERRRVERAMQEVNAAWTVLNDPRARRDYDASLRPPDPPAADRAATSGANRAAGRGATTTSPAGPPPVVLPDFDEGPRGPGLPAVVRIVPVVLLLGVLGAIFVLTAVATGDRSMDRPTPLTVDVDTPAVGSCVAVPGAVVQVSCDNPNAMRVERHAPGGADCGGGAVPLRWDGDITLCVRPPS